jgi:hypothetical protein
MRKQSRISVRHACEVVKFAAVDPGLSVFPAELLATRKATVVTGPAGKYRVFCYTSIGNKPSDPAIITVVIGDGSPVPPQPGPVVPPGPKPEEDIRKDPLFQGISGIVGGLSEPNQRASLEKLAGVYAEGAQVTGLSTLGELNNKMRTLSRNATMGNAIMVVRERLSSEIEQELGADGSQPLAGGLGDKARKLFDRIAKILREVARG